MQSCHGYRRRQEHNPSLNMGKKFIEKSVRIFEFMRVIPVVIKRILTVVKKSILTNVKEKTPTVLDSEISMRGLICTV